MAVGNWKRAEQLLAQAVENVSRDGHRAQLNEVYAVLLYLPQSGQILRKAACMPEVGRSLLAERDFIHLLTALPALACRQLRRGEVEEAVTIYALASRYAYVANSCWFADVVEARIIAAA